MSHCTKCDEDIYDIELGLCPECRREEKLSMQIKSIRESVYVYKKALFILSGRDKEVFDSAVESAMNEFENKGFIGCKKG